MKKLLLDPRLPGGLTLGAAVLLLLSPPVLGFAGTAAGFGAYGCQTKPWSRAARSRCMSPL